MNSARSVEQLSENDRLVAALGYLFTPVVPLIVLSGNQDIAASLRRHARQALYWALPFLVLLIAAIVLSIILLRVDFLFVCLLPLTVILPFVPGLIWAWRVYTGHDVVIPLITPRATRSPQD